MSARTPAGRFLACLRFELRKATRRRLYAASFGAVLGLTALAGWQAARAAEPAAGYALLVGVLETTLPVAAFLLMIAGSLAVNDEIASRAMRAVLLRPVARAEVVAAKVATLVAIALALAGTAWVAALFWVRAHGGFSPVVLEIEGFEPVVKFDVATMSAHLRRGFLATLPPLVCAPLFGLLLSVLIEAGGTAVAVALFFLFAMKAAGAVEAAAPWLFTTYLDRPLALLGEAAAGIETNVAALEALGPGSRDVLAPLCLAAAFAVAAALVFTRKEVRC